MGVLLHLVFWLLLFGAAVGLAAWRYRPELERAGQWFVERFGPFGMAAGSFLADGFHFPVPPQFYLLAAVAEGTSRGLALLAVLVGSALGGLAAFALGRTAAGTRLASRVMRLSRIHVEPLLARRGLRGLLLASLLPVSYWLICTVAGALRLPWRAYGVLALMRIPRILLSYLFIVAAWRSSL